ncbi:hypothetical protein ACFQZE_23700 [Paenibacillus sp. GCM10027627]|uniref:hypothetical protein n=1 Tax=unclassified Paenibacillus TaxID=185978 RepID=UPI00363D00B7
MKTGVSMNIERQTRKQKKDRKKRIREKAQEAKKAVGTILGMYIYRCTSCSNRVRLAEKLGERKILCTKCNAGVFAPAGK